MGDVIPFRRKKTERSIVDRIIDECMANVDESNGIDKKLIRNEIEKIIKDARDEVNQARIHLFDTSCTKHSDGECDKNS